MSDLIRQFENAVASAKTPPLGIKVTVDLWKALKSESLITLAPGEGMWPWDMWYYGKAAIMIDPELELRGVQWLLPPSSR